MNEDIIPITYMGGTGGNFLCHFIVSAKLNSNHRIPFSNHGNVHAFGMRDLPTLPTSIFDNDQDKINYLFLQLSQDQQKFGHRLVKPYIVALHLLDINMINSIFKKSIRITYDLDDINDITNSYYGKFYLDAKDPLTIKYPHSFIKKNIKKEITDLISDFSEIKNIPNVLFVSWKELVYNNIDTLVIRLSKFTDIDSNSFSKEALTEWRTKTHYCIEKFKDTYD